MPDQPFASDLAVTQYSASAMSFVANPANILGAVNRGVYLDGNFDVAAAVGQPIPEFPFTQQGDHLTLVLRQRYWQLATSFLPQALGTPSNTRADLVLTDEVDFHDEGGGVVSWDRVYANQPQMHDEWEDFSHGFQYLVRDSSSGLLKLNEIAFSVASRVRSEFFHVKDLANWPVLLAPRVVQLTDTNFYRRGQGNYTLAGSFFVTTDPQILAEDSKLHMWKHPWMQRRSRWIAGPTAAFLGDALNLS